MNPGVLLYLCLLVATYVFLTCLEQLPIWILQAHPHQVVSVYAELTPAWLRLHPPRLLHIQVGIWGGYGCDDSCTTLMFLLV